MNHDNAMSQDDGPIIHHGEPADWEPAGGEDALEAISAHIEAHLGPIDSVFHELLSDAVHIDVHIVRPTLAFPYTRLVTSGMSDLPMSTPAGTSVPKFVELLATIPGDWKLDQKAFEDEGWYWPVRLLKDLARLPHKHSTWIGFGHTVPNGDPAEPYAPNTQLAGAIILPSVTVPETFHTLTISPDKVIQFFAAVPIYPEEMELKLRSGTDALLDKFEEAELSDVVDAGRPNVARKRFRFF